MASERLRGSGLYLRFPFAMGVDGGVRSGRVEHVREQIAQVLLTGPGERVFVPEFGLGVRNLVFAPMTDELWSRIESALAAGVADALRGEAEPGSIVVSAGPAPGAENELHITIRYRLATLSKSEELTFTVANGALVAPGAAGAGDG
jgi:hypothetical protein